MVNPPATGSGAPASTPRTAPSNSRPAQTNDRMNRSRNKVFMVDTFSPQGRRRQGSVASQKRSATSRLPLLGYTPPPLPPAAFHVDPPVTPIVLMPPHPHRVRMRADDIATGFPDPAVSPHPVALDPHMVRAGRDRYRLHLRGWRRFHDHHSA